MSSFFDLFKFKKGSKGKNPNNDPNPHSIISLQTTPIDMNEDEEEYVYQHEGNFNTPLEEFTNYSSHFETDEEWSDRDKMIKWARELGRRLYIVIVIKNSWDTKVLLACEFSGVYKPKKKGKSGTIIQSENFWDLNLEPKSRKIYCPFELIGSSQRKSHKWVLTVKCGRHNHAVSTTLEGHPYAGRMTADELEDLRILSRANMEPRNIMSFIRQKYPGNTTSMKQIYNYRQRILKEEMGSMTVTQFGLYYLKSNGYYVDYRTVSGSDEIQDLFFSHPKSLQLLKLFPYVVIMDTTYKTNMYNIPLSEMVGFTCTNHTYNITFAFMARENQDHYEWVLGQLSELYRHIGKRPEAIVTDRKLAEMNAIGVLFPDAQHLLCWVHVMRNCAAYAQGLKMSESSAWWLD